MEERLGAASTQPTPMERRERLARLAALGKVAAEVGYRMNNLLAVLGTRLELADLCIQNNDRERALSNSQIARESLQKIETLAVRLVDFSGHPSQPIRGDLNSVVQATVSFARLLGPYENIDFDIDLAPDLYPVSIDPARWQQLLLSLFANSAEAVGRRKGEGGHIRISTVNDSSADRIVLTVQDEGKGIAPENLPRLFEPGFTTKGTWREGLGLTTCRRIAEEVGGEMKIESCQGRGTTVIIWIPASK